MFFSSCQERGTKKKMFIFIFPGRALTLTFTCNFNGNGHQRIDVQVYNGRKSNKHNVIVGDKKTTAAFLCFFK